MLNFPEPKYTVHGATKSLMYDPAATLAKGAGGPRFIFKTSRANSITKVHKVYRALEGSLKLAVSLNGANGCVRGPTNR